MRWSSPPIIEDIEEPSAEREADPLCGELYHQISNISHILAGNKIVDHSDLVGAVPNEMKNISVLGFGMPYIRGLTVGVSSHLPQDQYGGHCGQQY